MKKPKGCDQVKEKIMRKCKKCGKNHDLVLENMESGSFIDIDFCKDCLLTQEYTYIEMDPTAIHCDLGKELAKAEADIINRLQYGERAVRQDSGE